MHVNKNGSYILNISLPIVAEMIIITLISIIDLIMVGNAGGNLCVTAVGLSSGIMNVFVNIFITTGICIAITSIVSRKVGAKNYEEANEYASLGIAIGLIIAILIFIIIFFFCVRLLIIGGAKGEILYIAKGFTEISSFYIFILMVNSLINCLFRAHGDTYTPFFVSSLVFLSKLFINWLLIYKFKFFAVTISAAIASIFSELIGLTILIFFLSINKNIKLRIKFLFYLDKNKFMELIRLSIPSSLEEAAYSISRLLCSFIIMRSSSIAFAANEIANSIESISVMPGIGFGLASTTLAGINIGRNDYKRTKKNTRECSMLAVGIMSCFALVFVMIPDFLVKIYLNNSEYQVIKYASLCLAIGALEQPSIAISSVYAGALKGLGDTKTPFFISLISSWLIRLPLIYYFISIRRFSVVYVWWVTVIQWAFDAVLAVIFFKIKIIKYSFRYRTKNYRIM
ncbi:MAG: efflux family protein [Clostridiaceae bacterium]|jgi:putative MATE family efflux protein|nr:efflux family protein [Clostridiaceae bacterium]